MLTLVEVPSLHNVDNVLHLSIAIVGVLGSPAHSSASLNCLVHVSALSTATIIINKVSISNVTLFKMNDEDI